MKVRVSNKKGVTSVKLLADHPMHTGRSKDSKGDVIPGHYITELKAELNGKTVMTAFLGPAVSKDPYVKFSFNGGEKGDKITLSWVDNKDKSETAEAVIS